MNWLKVKFGIRFYTFYNLIKTEVNYRSRHLISHFFYKEFFGHRAIAIESIKVYS